MNRREFARKAGLFGAAGAVMGRTVLAPALSRAAESIANPSAQANVITARHIPRWREFNLQGDFAAATKDAGRPAYDEADFVAMRDWGFNFARLPVSYWEWGNKDNWSEVREAPLKQIDSAIAMGKRYAIHTNLNIHRIPGYCINQRQLEPADLFTGRKEERERALAAAIFHWKMLASRYRGIPNAELSFDLINEPPKMRSYEGALEERYVEIVKALVGEIREVDPGRLIFADGINIGQSPVLGIVDLGLVQSTRGYLPKAVSHYTANWVPHDEFEAFGVPSWPLKDDNGQVWDRARLKHEYVDRYQPIIDRGVQIHVGEWGCFNKTPHAVALAWMRDSLSIWKEAGWGYSLWNLRGEFGVMDSGRRDVAYEEYRGHKLDRQMLELLQSY